MTRVRRLGRSELEVAAYVAAERAFEAAWLDVFRHNSLDPRLVEIAAIRAAKTDKIVADVIARHVVRVAPSCVGRLRPRARVHHRQRCAVRRAGKATTIGDPDEESLPRIVWPSKGGGR